MGNSLSATAPVSECPSRDSHSRRVRYLAKLLQPYLDDGFNPLDVARRILREDLDEFDDEKLCIYERITVLKEDDGKCDNFSTVCQLQNCAGAFRNWVDNEKDGGSEIEELEEQILFPLSRLFDKDGNMRYCELRLR